MPKPNPWMERGGVYKSHRLNLIRNMDGRPIRNACYSMSLITDPENTSLADLTDRRQHNEELLSLLEGGTLETFIVFREILREHSAKSLEECVRDFDTVVNSATGNDPSSASNNSDAVGVDRDDEDEDDEGPNPWESDEFNAKFHDWLLKLPAVILGEASLKRKLITEAEQRMYLLPIRNDSMAHNMKFLEIVKLRERSGLKTFLLVLVDMGHDVKAKSIAKKLLGMTLKDILS